MHYKERSARYSKFHRPFPQVTTWIRIVENASIASGWANADGKKVTMRLVLPTKCVPRVLEEVKGVPI